MSACLDKRTDEERKKKTEGEFTGINEIADETVVGGSGINAVRHLQFNGVVDEAEDNYEDDDFDDNDDYDDEYDDEDFS